MALFQNLWFAPQISEHCPYRILGRLTEDLVWLSRPGVACAFNHNLGIVRVCSSYAVVTIIQIGSLWVGRFACLCIAVGRFLVDILLVAMHTSRILALLSLKIHTPSIIGVLQLSMLLLGYEFHFFRYTLDVKKRLLPNSPLIQL